MTSTPASVSERVDVALAKIGALETRLRRWRSCALSATAVLVVAGASLLLGAGAFDKPKIDLVAHDGRGIIQASAFEVVDSEGRVLVRLAASEEVDLQQELNRLKEDMRRQIEQLENEAAGRTTRPVQISESRAASRGDGIITLFAHDGSLQGEWAHGRLRLPGSPTDPKKGGIHLDPRFSGHQVGVRDEDNRTLAAIGIDRKTQGIVCVDSSTNGVQATLRAPSLSTDNPITIRERRR